MSHSGVNKILSIFGKNNHRQFRPDNSPACQASMGVGLIHTTDTSSPNTVMLSSVWYDGQGGLKQKPAAPPEES